MDPTWMTTPEWRAIMPGIKARSSRTGRQRVYVEYVLPDGIGKHRKPAGRLIAGTDIVD